MSERVVWTKQLVPDSEVDFSFPGTVVVTLKSNYGGVLHVIDSEDGMYRLLEPSDSAEPVRSSWPREAVLALSDYLVPDSLVPDSVYTTTAHTFPSPLDFGVNT